ncbi:MAG: glycosyltransferase [Thermodesulfobacteriota bacterium]
MNQPLVLHDFFNAPDGGGKVAAILAQSFNAELWTGELNKAAFPPNYFKGVTPQSLEAYKSTPAWLKFSKIFQLWWAFAHFPKASPPWTVFSGSFSPLAHKRISGHKIFYCLTPPRLLYDQKAFILGRVPEWQRPLLRGVMFLYRLAYERAIGRMDCIITLSQTVRKRIIRYLGYNSVVVYPPCEVERFRWIAEGDFYLSTARVDSLKRVDLIVRAFKQMPHKKLMVVSGGTDLPRIKQIAAGALNIQILGWVGETKLEDLMGRCVATVYIPRDEDFGMSPVESMAAGKPVIGVQEGGVVETVGDRGPRSEVGSRRSEVRGERGNRGKYNERMTVSECGVLVPPAPQVKDMVKAVEWMSPEKAREMRESCEKRAQRFSTDVFIRKMREVIEGNGQ